MNVNVQIDRLILDGIPLSPDERPILQATIESELSRLIETQGWRVATDNANVYRLSAEPIRIGRSHDGTSIGQQIARSVHGGNMR